MHETPCLVAILVAGLLGALNALFIVDPTLVALGFSRSTKYFVAFPAGYILAVVEMAAIIKVLSRNR